MVPRFLNNVPALVADVLDKVLADIARLNCPIKGLA